MKPARQFGRAMQIFSCFLKIIPKKMNNDNGLKFELHDQIVGLSLLLLVRHIFGHEKLKNFLNIIFITVVAFLVALNQNKQLLGVDGLLPIPNFLDHVRNYFGGKFRLSSFQAVPTLLWAVEPKEIDKYLDIIAYCGGLLSLFVVYTGCCNMLIMLTLWILYHSLVSIGQRWYVRHFDLNTIIVNLLHSDWLKRSKKCENLRLKITFNLHTSAPAITSGKFKTILK